MLLANTTMQYQASAIRAKPVCFTFLSVVAQALNVVIDAIITSSWDRTVRFWDARAPTAQQSSYQLPERVYLMDTVGHGLVVALASRLFHIFDVRKMDKPEQTRESSLKFLTRALACMSNSEGAPCLTLTFPRSPSHSFNSTFQGTPRRPSRVALPSNTSTPRQQCKRKSTRSNATARRSMTWTTSGP